VDGLGPSGGSAGVTSAYRDSPEKIQALIPRFLKRRPIRQGARMVLHQTSDVKKEMISVLFLSDRKCHWLKLMGTKSKSKSLSKSEQLPYK
jgi:hypothetical protein